MHYKRVDDKPEYGDESVDDEATYVAQEAVVEGRPLPAATLAALGWTVGLAGVIVVALLAFRLGFEMGDANPANSAVETVYDITSPLVQPFQGVADPNELDNGGVFYPETAIAMGAYLIAAALLMMTLYAWASYVSTAEDRHVVRRSRVVRQH